jgi:3'-phosphoadenosine 5'-phosphosulfate sulfotransferase (PAPS reductase)/FAD synthetase
MFSTGKDAICCLHILCTMYGIKPKLLFWNIHPFLLQLNRDPLEYFAETYGVEYEVIPHHDVFCDTARKIGKKAPLFREWLAKLYYDHGEMAQVFGNKDSDGLSTKLLCNKGARENMHRFYPLYRWKDNHVRQYLNDERVALPRCYNHGFRDINEFTSIASIDYLKENYPADYERLNAFSPLVAIDV